MRIETISILVASAAFVLSALTFWLNHLRVGSIRMTRPNVLYFGPDGGLRPQPKVYLRAHLYSTAQKGQILEDFYVTLEKEEVVQIFPIWVFGDTGNLKRGSGLFIGRDGVSIAHHFLLPPSVKNFKFSSGKYKCSVFAKTVGKSNSNELFCTNLEVTVGQATAIENGSGLYFDSWPDSLTYIPHIDKRELDPEVTAFWNDLNNKMFS